jgi:UDP-N-acetylmuramate dehydrogenase
MDHDRFQQQLTAALPGARVHRDAPLAPFTTFKVGGPADWLVDVTSPDELTAALAAAHECRVPVTLLGGGSNVLIADSGIRGVVIRLKLAAISQPSPSQVRAEAGATINGLVRWTVGRGLAGLEAWAGTPGTVGGAIYGNAHFGGRNIGDLVTAVMVVAPEATTRLLTRDEMQFAYDASRIQQTREVVISADFAVEHGHPDALREIARVSLAYRKRTQPLETPSAGCIFQNPDPARDAVPAGVPASAGALVDRAGLKGHRLGGARISPTHANFFLNDGDARAADIRALIDLARRAVHEKFGVELREEIVSLGDFAMREAAGR